MKSNYNWAVPDQTAGGILFFAMGDSSGYQATTVAHKQSHIMFWGFLFFLLQDISCCLIKQLNIIVNIKTHIFFFLERDMLQWLQWYPPGSFQHYVRVPAKWIAFSPNDLPERMPRRCFEDGLYIKFVNGKILSQSRRLCSLVRLLHWYADDKLLYLS